VTGPILVTGASGLVGSHLLPLLAGAGEVLAVGRTPPLAAQPNLVPVAIDLSRPLDPSALPGRTEALVYLAQSNRHRDFPEAAADIFEVNAAQLAAMLRHAHRTGARSFVYASTGSVYRPGDGPLREDSPLPPPGSLGFYAATKLCGELLAGGYCGLMNVVILRFFFVYGRGQKRHMLIPRLVDSVRSGTPVTLQGADGIRINPVHASDAAAAVAAALTLEGTHRINVAGPETLSLREAAETIAGLVAVPPVFAAGEGEPLDVVADTGLMARLLGAPVRRFRDGVADLI
jgi:UDP-glucose 4-epimerase